MDVKDLLILSMVKRIGPAYIKKNRARLMQSVSCDAIVREVNPDEIENLDAYFKAADEIIKDCRSNDIKMTSILDDDYPTTLAEIGDPPCVLFYKGNLELTNNAIAIVGTRRSTSLGNRIAERLGSYFASNYAICNGLVEGIDSSAISNLGQAKSNVVGVISGGLNYKETCSAAHCATIEKVIESGGLVVSEFYPNQKEDKFSGSKASRIQAGLSKGLILVQSSVDGGTKYTVSTFSKLNRPLGVISFQNSKEFQDDDSFGANRLIVNKGVQGVADFIGAKKLSSICIKDIVRIETKVDYERMEEAMKDTTLFA